MKLTDESRCFLASCSLAHLDSLECLRVALS